MVLINLLIVKKQIASITPGPEVPCKHNYYALLWNTYFRLVNRGI